MDTRKGEDVFSTLTLGTNHSIYPAMKRTKPFEGNSAKERGETFFHQKQSFRALPRRQTNLISKQQTLQQKIPPGNDSLGRGETFFKNHPNERRLGQQQITSKKILRQEKTKAGGRRFSPRAPRQYYSTNLRCKYA